MKAANGLLDVAAVPLPVATAEVARVLEAMGAMAAEVSGCGAYVVPGMRPTWLVWTLPTADGTAAFVAPAGAGAAAVMNWT